MSGLADLSTRSYSSRNILDRIAKLLADPDQFVCGSAAAAVGGMGGAAVTPVILERIAGLLAHPDKYIRSRAAGAVGKMGGAAATPVILDRIAGLLTDPVPDVRESAAASRPTLTLPVRVREVSKEPQHGTT